MAVTVDWPTKVISVTQSFLTFIGGDVYELDTDAFRYALKDAEDSEAGITNLVTHNHNSTVLLGGIEYARVIEIINGYTITFEETGSPYVVNITGSNNNILDVTNLGTVQLRSNNSAGLVNVLEIQQGIFNNEIIVSQATGSAGTLYPKGTSLAPVNNINDAVAIGNIRGISRIRIEGLYVFGASDVLNGFVVEGVSAAKTTCVLSAAATISNNVFRDCTITGALDGGNDCSGCIIAGLNYVDGTLLECFLANGDIVLNGTQANLILCGSAVPGGGAGQYPVIDLGGGGTHVVVRDYHGGISFKNCSTDTGSVSIDMSSGRVHFDSTISSGTYTVRGIAEIQDESTGTAVIIDETPAASLTRIDKTTGLNLKLTY